MYLDGRIDFSAICFGTLLHLVSQLALPALPASRASARLTDLLAPIAQERHPIRDPAKTDALLSQPPGSNGEGHPYPLTQSEVRCPHTRCTSGSRPGRPDRPGGMYPLRVGVTMSIHKLTAGSGYDYLTRQVAALDATEKGHIGLASYYTERGESPGVWIGSGMDGIDGLTAGDPVTAEQMRALFGCGLHPLAELRQQQLEGPDLTQRDYQDVTRLGRAVQDR